MNNLEQNYTLNTAIKGHVRIWEYSPDVGIGKLLFDKPNLITYQGADIAARALAGQLNSAINYIYVGYDTGSHPTITPALGDNAASFSTKIAVPLAYAPGFSTTDNTKYQTNEAFYTIYLTGFDGTRTTSLVNGDFINSLGLINRVAGTDYLFSHIAVSPYVTYNHSLAITWGLTFTSS